VDLRLRQRPEEDDVGAGLAHLALQVGAVQAVADQHRGDRLVPQQGHGGDEVVHGVGRRHPARVAEDAAAAGAEAVDQPDEGLRGLIGCRRGVDPVRDGDHRGVDAERADVRLDVGKDRDDRVAVAIRGALGRGHGRHQRVPRGVPAELDGRQRPQVVDLVDQPRPGEPGEALREVGVERVGRRRDDRVGPQLAGHGLGRAQAAAHVVDPAEDAPRAVALVLAGAQEAELHAVDVVGPAGLRVGEVAGAEVAVGAGDDRGVGPEPRPLDRHGVRAVLHPRRRRSRVVV